MYAKTIDGKITKCTAKTVGNGRCNHIAHQEKDESIIDFVKRTNDSVETKSVPLEREKLKNIPSEEEKYNLSGNFSSCKFVKGDKIEEYCKLLDGAGKSYHYREENLGRESNIQKYEQQYGTGKVQEMFVVDRKHIDGKELHVIKNNGIIEIYNINKLVSKEDRGKSLVTKLIARKPQVMRYYTWNDCYTPKYLKDIATINEQEGKNRW